MKTDKTFAIFCALLAAVFYALGAPLSKVLLREVPPLFAASFLYLGAGLGMGIIYAFRFGHEERSSRLDRHDAPYTVLMVLLDIAAPICLMVGIKQSEASSASLLGNFEIAATTLIAAILFHERVSKRLALSIVLIMASSIILSVDDVSGLQFSRGSLFVILATVCWGLENNCTRSISHKSAYQIVTLKGLFSALGSFAIACAAGEHIPPFTYAAYTVGTGFVAYGLSIFMYVRAQRDLGAAKTAAFYAAAPFVSALLCVVMLGERPAVSFYAALVVMIAGALLAVLDTL